MRVAVLDVGSNTVRLLVASVEAGRVVPIHEEREHLGLAAEILHRGSIGKRKLTEVASVAGQYAHAARRHGVSRFETVVTGPGRQSAEPQRLVDALTQATGAPVRLVSGDDEGRLAYAGAVATYAVSADVIGVCDVGGGTTELVIGTPTLGPVWVRSLDLGSLRLTATRLHTDPPTGDEVEAARADVRALLTPLAPPRPEVALATGGSARALGRVLGGSYGVAELDELIPTLGHRSSGTLAKQLRIGQDRARTLLAGAIVLRELAALLDLRLTPARGGLREAVALRLAAAREAA